MTLCSTNELRERVTVTAAEEEKKVPAEVKVSATVFL